MSPTDFIYTNIANQLIKDGYSQGVVSIGANAGVEEYKRRSCATIKGRIFDDCLYHAKQVAKLHQKKATKSH